MQSQALDKNERPDPIQERVGEGMFTDREEDMASLMEWVEIVAQKYGRSRALVSHRRYGKTAIMEHLYNRLFWEREDVMPFYFELEEKPLWIDTLVAIYLHSFLQQFLAYRTRDPLLAFKRRVSLKQLYALAEQTDEEVVLETIDYWLEIKDSGNPYEIESMMRDTPHLFAARTGLSIIVMFDEFQRLDQVLYDDAEKTRKSHRLTGSFATAAESSRAPMLIAGSQVTVLTEDALGGAMNGRVGTRYIKRLPLEGAAELVLKFARRRRLNIPLDLAYTMGRLVDGHPYYIWCLFHSEFSKRDLTTEAGIEATLAFEVEQRVGYIRKFWMRHFSLNMETLNRPYARQMVFYLSQYVDKEVRIEKLAEDLKLPLSLDEIHETLRRLIWCDLIRERGDRFYGGLSDPILAQMLRIEYSWEIEQLTRDEVMAQVKAAWQQEMFAAKDELITKLRGELSYWTGRFAEMFIDKLMKRHFNNQTVDGNRYFNHNGEVQLSRFERLFTTMTQPAGAVRSYQVDLYGIPSEDEVQPDRRPWVVEVKNWQQVVNQPEVEHFWEAMQTLAQDRGHDEVVGWFYARSGFSGPAKEFMAEKGILYSDEAGLIRLLTDLQVVEKWREEE